MEDRTGFFATLRMTGSVFLVILREPPFPFLLRPLDKRPFRLRIRILRLIVTLRAFPSTVILRERRGRRISLPLVILNEVKNPGLW